MTPAAAVVLACVVFEICALTTTRWSEPRNHDIRRYVLGEIHDAHRVEQRFKMRANGLSSVTIHPRPASPAPSGMVIVQLRDVTDERNPRLVKRTSISTSSLADADSFSTRFPPQLSRYREYALEIAIEDGSDGQGIGVLSTRGEGPHGTVLFINGRRWYGGLVFETSVDPLRSNFGLIAARLGERGVPVPTVVLILLLIVKNVALFFVIRAFVPFSLVPIPRTQTLPSPPV